MATLTEEEEILAFDVSDEALEFAGAIRPTLRGGFALWISLGAFRQSFSVTRTHTGSLRSAAGSYQACLDRRTNRHSKHWREHGIVSPISAKLGP
jgi:hypothetical protein